MTPFAQKTYALLKQVPKGRVTTYKQLAHALHTRAYRAIGQLMKHNPYSFEACPERSRRVPCHRVIASDGTIGGFMGQTNGTHIAKKKSMLKREGIPVVGNTIKDFEKYLYRFR